MACEAIEVYNECQNTLCRILNQYIDIVNEIIAVTIGHESAIHLRQEQSQPESAVSSAITCMLLAVGSSSNTILKLSESPGLQTRDCYVVARLIIETSVNICYILAVGEEAAERSIRHSRQKAYRDLDRNSVIGSSNIEFKLANDDNKELLAIVREELKKDILEFTSLTGREKSWVDLSIDDRIEIAGGKLNESILTKLHYARFMIYRDSSEILHGSYHGTFLFFRGCLKEARHDSEDIIRSIGSQHILILLSIIIAINAIVESFHMIYGFISVYQKSRDLFKSIYDLQYFNHSS